MSSVLRLPRFRALLGAYAVNGLGDWLGEIALSLVVLRATGSVVAVTALWLLGRFVPVLIAPALVARLRPARLALPVVLAAEGLVFALLAAAWPLLPTAAILALALLDGVLALAARSLLKAAAFSATRPRGLEREATAAIVTAFAVTTTAGPLLGGVATGVLGPSAALALDAASFLGAALLVSRPAAEDGAAPPSGGRVARRALAHLRAHPLLGRLCAIEGLASIAFSMVLPIEVAYVTGPLGGTAADAGLVLGAWGIGALAGSLALGRLRRAPLPVLLYGALAVMAVSYAGMGLAGSVTVVAAFSLVGGLGNGVEPFAFTACVQEHTPGALQAEVAALVEALQTAAPGVGFLAGGAVAALASPRAAYLLAAVGVTALLPAVISAHARGERRAVGHQGLAAAQLDEPVALVTA